MERRHFIRTQDRERMARVKPKRGEVWWTDFNSSVGTEIQKKRPVVIVSNDISNRLLDRVQVVPLTSNTDKVYPSECVIVVKKQKGKVMADQIATVDISRIIKKVTQVSSRDMKEIGRVVRMQLGLE